MKIGLQRLCLKSTRLATENRANTPVWARNGCVPAQPSVAVLWWCLVRDWVRSVCVIDLNGTDIQGRRIARPGGLPLTRQD